MRTLSIRSKLNRWLPFKSYRRFLNLLFIWMSIIGITLYAVLGTFGIYYHGLSIWAGAGLIYGVVFAFSTPPD